MNRRIKKAGILLNSSLFPALSLQRSSPDHSLGVALGGPAVQGAVQDTEGGAEVASRITDGRLFLPEQGMGDEARRLEQAIGLGTVEGGASIDPL